MQTIISNSIKKEEIKFFKWVENAMGKGEIACCEQFLLFPHYFQETCIAETKNPELASEKVNR